MTVSHPVLAALILSLAWNPALYADGPPTVTAPVETEVAPDAVEPPNDETDETADEKKPDEDFESADENAGDQENAGLADLDEATKLKIGAENFADLANVIDLSERALRKGLDKQNTEFAKQIIVSTRLERANRICQEIFDRDPPNANWPNLAQIALQDLSETLRVKDDVAEAHLLLGRIQTLPGGNAKRARAALDNAIRHSGEDLATKALALTLRADLETDVKQKLADLDEALRLQPQLVVALRARGAYYITNDKIDGAVADLKKAVSLEPDHARTHVALALGLLLNNQIELAHTHLNRALELDPDTATAYSYRAQIHLRKDDTAQALADINSAIDRVTDNLTWRLLRAQIHHAAGDTEAALTDVERVLAVDAKLLDAVRMRASLLASADRTDEAIAGLERAVAAMRDNDELSLNLALMYSSNKQTEQALKIYKKLLERDDPHWGVFRSRGDLMLTLGRQTDAMADYEEALKLKPGDSGLLNNLAWILATSPNATIRDGKRAIKLATEACEATKYGAAHILSTLAAAYAESGDFEQAIKWSTKAVELGGEQYGEQLTAELESYKAGKPWRELQGGDKEEDAENDAEEE